MPVDTEQIKKAFGEFEDENFIGSKEILQKEIKAAKDEFIKNKLGLQKDVEKNVEKDVEDEKGEDKDKE